jgi:hypothetical protein
MGSERSFLYHNSFYPRKKPPRIRWIGGWADPRTSLGAEMGENKILSCQESNRFLGCPAQSLVIIAIYLSWLFSKDNFIFSCVQATACTYHILQHVFEI